MLAVGIDGRHHFRQGDVAIGCDLLQSLPECIFETDAGLVTRNDDRTLDDERLHKPPPIPPGPDANFEFNYARKVAQAAPCIAKDAALLYKMDREGFTSNLFKSVLAASAA